MSCLSPQMKMWHSWLIEEGLVTIGMLVIMGIQETVINLGMSIIYGGRGISGYKRPFCEHCNINGHIVDKCFKIHGYPNSQRPGTIPAIDGASQFPEEC